MEDEALGLGWYWSENKKEWQMAKIAQQGRSSHLHIIGGTRMGKSKFMEFLISQDIGKNGFGLLDPHGDLVEDVKNWLYFKLRQIEEEQGEKEAERFYERIVLIDPTNPNELPCFNPLENIPGISSAEQALELVGAFKKIWADSWGARMEDILRNSLVVLIENNLTLLELPLFLTDKNFRSRLLKNTQNPIAKHYFLSRFEKHPPKITDQWTESTSERVNAFLVDDRIRLMLSRPKSTFNFREIMDNQKILLVKLTKGKLKGGSDLLGSLILSKLWMAASSRSDIPKSKRIPFYLFIDEFQNFTSENFCEILSEAGKYGLFLTMAHQYLGQLPKVPGKDLLGSILGNTGLQVYFRVSRQDTKILAQEAFKSTGTKVKNVKLSEQNFDYDYYTYPEEWEFFFQELQRLPPRSCYIKHKIEGGLIQINTEQIPELWKVGGYESEEELKAAIEAINLGSPYFVSKDKLDEESQKRLEELLEERPEKPNDFRE